MQLGPAESVEQLKFVLINRPSLVPGPLHSFCSLPGNEAVIDLNIRLLCSAIHLEFVHGTA